jgi:RNA polymerase sigma-70 factor (ECF subfamily)
MRGGKITYLRASGARPAEMADVALVAACGTGDRVALGELYKRFHRDVYRFLARLSGCDARDLDDLVQNTFMNALEGARRFAGRSSVKTWLFGIAANVAKHHFRGEARRQRAMHSLTDLPSPTSDAPSSAAERKEMLARLRKGLDDLPHDLRVAFVMCAIEEIPGVEAATILGIRQGTVWRRLHEARKALIDAVERRRS